MTTVGVVSFQGDFEQHISHLEGLGSATRRIRDKESLHGIDALVLPGGESTTIGMLLERFGLASEIRQLIRDGLPVFGTCAGIILLADAIEGSDQPRLGGLNASIRRNAYGRQIESFEAPLVINESAWPGTEYPPPPGVFIRAPIIESQGPEVTTLLTFENQPVLVRQANILAATFHPELTSNSSIHAFFLDELVGRRR